MAVFKWLSAIDFTNLQAWANGLPSTLTQPAIALLWNNGSITTTSGTPILSLTGHTTSTSNTISIQCAPGESFVNSLGTSTALAFSTTSGVNFVLPSTGIGNTNYFLIQDANVFITGLQFQDPNGSSVSTILQVTHTCTIQQCIFDGFGQGSGAAIVYGALSGPSSSVFTFVNNLIVDRAGGSSSASTLKTNFNTVFASNTIVLINASTSQVGIDNTTAASGVSVKVVNNILIGYAASFAMHASSGTITESYSAVSSASLTGTGVTVGAGNVYSQTAAGTFVAATTNFRLLSTSGALNVGFTDTADIPTAIDILGVSRPQGTAWDIGAHELFNPVSVGTGGGQASGSAVSGVGSFAIGTGGGQASGLAVPGFSNVTTGLGGGHASGVAVSNGNISVGTGGGQASGVAFVATGAIGVAITLNPIGTQTLNVPFDASGTYTLTPLLQFANDTDLTFTPIPTSGISSVGSTQFDFVHPGVSTLGQHNLLVEDLVTDTAAAQNYTVAATAPPPPTPVNPAASFETGSLTALSSIIPAYLYQQYADDDNLQALVAAYNIIAQSYLDWFNAINLPIYTGPLIVGPLLDWVATGIYGIPRPTIAITQTLGTTGDFNTYDLNTIDFNGFGATTASQFFTVTDDIYKRLLTWSLYKGDGKQFNTIWLKRRVARFLAGVNGTDYTGPTDQVSVVFSGSNTVTITLTNGVIPLSSAAIFQAAVLTGSLPLPFQYNFQVLINAPPVQAPTTPQLVFNIVADSQYLGAFGF